MMPLDEPHRVLRLSDASAPDCHRPEIRVWTGAEAAAPPEHVTLYLGALHGQQVRFADLLPDEARSLAHMLTQAAYAVEHALAEAE
jgi:hypothetical protein